MIESVMSHSLLLLERNRIRYILRENNNRVTNNNNNSDLYLLNLISRVIL